MNRINRNIFLFISLFILSVSINVNAEVFQPRFASLSSSLINLRTGPGMQYPIEWIFKKRDYPVEITEQYDTWRKIKTIDGTTGWVHQGMVSSRRYAIVSDKTNLMRSSKPKSKIVAIIEPNVVVKLISCPKESEMCRAEVKGKHGFILRKNLWGIYLNENF